MVPLDSANPDAPPATDSVSLREATWTWCRVAALSFGGPTAQIAVMHRLIVEEKRWISEAQFLHALNFCMLIPGPEAQQLATYIGWLLHGTRGGLIAGILFVLPGFAAILTLSLMYTYYGDTLFLQGLFLGLKPAVIAIVAAAVLRIGNRVLRNSAMVAIAVASFCLLFFGGIPFPAVIALAAGVGLIGGRWAPRLFEVLGQHAHPQPAEATAIGDGAVSTDRNPRRPVVPSWRRVMLVSAICLPLWWGPVFAAWLLLGPESVYVQEGLFFSKAAMVTFGGAYSVLAYVDQQAVEHFHWLDRGEMMHGLAMAETTPGPLIMVVQFVGYLGAWRAPAPFSPLVGGLLGSVLTTWVTFAPCFYWIFLGAPYIERLRGHRGLNAGLSAVTAAVVGVVANLAVAFVLQTLFSHVEVLHLSGPSGAIWPLSGLRLMVPELTTWQPAATAIAIVSMGLIFVARRGIGTTLLIACGLGLMARWFGMH